MQPFHAWMHTVATEPLPGGVSAAALSSAMGAALVAKATRVTLQRSSASERNCQALLDLLALATQESTALVNLAEADEHAFRAVLANHARAPGSGTEAGIWHEAVELPIRLAEACHCILGFLPKAVESCWPAVETDLLVGQWLLEVGLRAGCLAAEGNLAAWADHLEAAPLRARLEALTPSQPDASE